VYFCNRECQVVARKELGHRGANCRPVVDDDDDEPPVQGPVATPVDRARLDRGYRDLMDTARAMHMANTRIGQLAAIGKFRGAAAMADRLGGAVGAGLRANADQLRSGCLLRVGDKAAAARAACSSLRAARASGNRSMLVTALSSCGEMAGAAPREMYIADRESREQERLSVSPSYGGLDLSREGLVSLPTTPAAVSRLGLAYNEAAVAICDAASAAADGCDSPAADDHQRFPNLIAEEARARGILGACLCRLGEEQQRSLELIRQAVELWRLMVRTAAPGRDTLSAQQNLADELFVLGAMLNRSTDGHRSEGMAEAEACLREALALSESLGDVGITSKTLRNLINLCGEVHATVGPTEAVAFLSRLNQLLVQMDRSPETSCSICLEPLAQPADVAEEGAAGGGDSGSAGGPSDSFVRVLSCNHQFHYGCLRTWQREASNGACPVCRR